MVVFFVLFFIIIPSLSLVFGTCGSCTQLTFNIKYGLKDKVLKDQRHLKETEVANDVECFESCNMDCRCTSFNVCHGNKCQLNERNRYLVTNATRSQLGCTYYDFPLLENTCETQSMGPLGPCCNTKPSLCFNGGICEVNISDTTRRFYCKCPTGFYGKQCHVNKPKSCFDYWVGPHKPTSGKYIIEDESGTLYKIFCDFDSEDGVVWTLIESFAMSNEGQLLSYPFTLDYPLNPQTFSWVLFRLPRNVMVNIASRSKYWRSTCSFPEYGVDYRDYTRVRMSELDPTVFVGIVTYKPESCILIDYIDVKGTSCTNCTTTIFQLTNEMLHLNLYYGRHLHSCNFDSSNVEYFCQSEQARLLGVYFKCSDPSYRCSQSPSSTTQFWFGEIKS